MQLIVLVISLNCSCTYSDNPKSPEIITEFEISTCEDIPIAEFQVDSIINDLNDEKLDSSINQNFGYLLDNMIAKLDSSKNHPNVLFPYGNIDSAKFFDYKNWLIVENEPHDLEDRTPIRILTLCDEEISALIDFMNTPSNFQWGECGTAIPEFKIEFYSQGKTKHILEFACNYSQLSYKPFHNLTRFGGISEKGQKLIWQLLFDE